VNPLHPATRIRSDMDETDVDAAVVRRRDAARHHPRVRRDASGWRWTCVCGSATCRTGELPTSWREAVVEALDHSGSLPG